MSLLAQDHNMWASSNVPAHEGFKLTKELNIKYYGNDCLKEFKSWEGIQHESSTIDIIADWHVFCLNEYMKDMLIHICQWEGSTEERINERRSLNSFLKVLHVLDQIQLIFKKPIFFERARWLMDKLCFVYDSL